MTRTLIELIAEEKVMTVFRNDGVTVTGVAEKDVPRNGILRIGDHVIKLSGIFSVAFKGYLIQV